jgi:hypothetical protein
MDEEADAQQATDILVAISNTRDVDSCLRGLNQLRKAAKSDHGAGILVALVKQSPQFAELQAIWDAQLTVRAPPACMLQQPAAAARHKRRPPPPPPHRARLTAPAAPELPRHGHGAPHLHRRLDRLLLRL